MKVSAQLVFISDLKQRTVSNREPRRQPGRQLVAFLIICNISLWIIYNFEAFKVTKNVFCPSLA